MEKKNIKFRGNTALILLTLAVCGLGLIAYPLVAAVVDGSPFPASQKAPDTVKMNFVFKNCTTLITRATNEKLILNNKSIDPKTWSMPRNIKKYDLVTLDQQQINRYLRSPTPSLSILIYGIEYQATLERMNFENIDDGIDSYSGSVIGKPECKIGMTISNKSTVGHVTLTPYGETFWFGPVASVPGDLVNGDAPLHYIYSSRDVEPGQESLIDHGTASLPPR